MGLASGMVSPCIASVAILVIRKLMLKTDNNDRLTAFDPGQPG